MSFIAAADAGVDELQVQGMSFIAADDAGDVELQVQGMSFIAADDAGVVNCRCRECHSLLLMMLVMLNCRNE